MSSAVAVARERAMKAAEMEAAELNRQRELFFAQGGMMGVPESGAAGPAMRPVAETPSHSLTNADQPPAKVRKLNDVLDGVDTTSGAVAPDQEQAAAHEAAEAEAREAKLDRPSWHKQVKSAQWWYYQDQNFQRTMNPQGPYYPGQMRDWFTQGYFTENLMIAPSFQGEMPQKYARIIEAFKYPLYEHAFVPGDSIANYPPEQEVQVIKKEVTKEELIRTLMRSTPGQEFQMSAISFN